MEKKVVSAKTRTQAKQGPLAARLDAIADDFSVRLPNYALALDEFVTRLQKAKAGATAPNLGDTFPDFALPDAKGKIWHLARCIAAGPVILSFHRGSWCDFCQVNMQALTEIAPQVAALGGQILAIAPEQAKPNAVFETKAALGIPILRDFGLGVSTMVGLTCFVDDSLRHQLELLQVDVSAANGGIGWLVPIPATFVLNPRGLVVSRHVDPDPRTRMECQDIIQAATAIQSAARS